MRAGGRHKQRAGALGDKISGAAGNHAIKRVFWRDRHIEMEGREQPVSMRKQADSEHRRASGVIFVAPSE